MESGGIVSLAHPIETQLKHNLDYHELSKMVSKLKDKGLRGIEVFHSAHGRKEEYEYLKIAKNMNLFITGGSDYHGTNKDVTIGQLTNYNLCQNKIIDKITLPSVK